MNLKQLNVYHVRNISFAQCGLHPRYNIILGPNGSGKTSFLEAIYLLGTGHSFRTRESSPLITYGQKSLTVFARTEDEQTISVQKTFSCPTVVRLNKRACYSSSELARFLPCQIFHQDLFQIIDRGASVRRGLLDWGLFHVKQSYHALWKDYRRVLKQRNALLRQKVNPEQCAPWDKMLVELAYELDKFRSAYFDIWSLTFQDFLSQLSDISCSIRYDKGWDRKNTGKHLKSILAEQFFSDCQRQYTQSGAHQADVVIDFPPSPKAKQVLSRGQQKILLIALKLAQAHLLEKSCVYLFDDMAAELDEKHLNRLLGCLSRIKGQFFFTAIDPNFAHLFNELGDSVVYCAEQGQFRMVSRET